MTTSSGSPWDPTATHGVNSPGEPPARATGQKPNWRRGLLHAVIPVTALLAGVGIGVASAGGEPTKSTEYQALEQDRAGQQDRIDELSDLAQDAQATARAAREELAQAQTDLDARAAELDARAAELEQREADVLAREQAGTAAGNPDAADPSTSTPAPPAGEDLSPGQENARQTASDYLSYTSFSRTGLIRQLEFEGYSDADATWAVDDLSVDWNDQAAEKAAEYLAYTSFSRQGLIDQLIFEGFSPAEAEYGVAQEYDGG
jgi:hypothetical protein